jgi:hypothetical protein
MISRRRQDGWAARLPEGGSLRACQPSSVVGRLALLTLVSVLVAGCGSSLSQVATSPQPAAASLEKQQLALLESAISSFQAAGVSWTYEPPGDVPLDSSGAAGTIVFADVLAVRPDRGLVRFDCVQIFTGRAARREARRGGYGDLANVPVWFRNAHKHAQELPLAKEAVVVYTAEPMSRQQFLRRCRENPDRYTAGPGCWMVVGPNGEIEVMVEEWVT